MEIQVIGGLCNRLRGLIGFFIKARDENKRLIVYWVPDKFCNCLFTDIFELSSLYTLYEGTTLEIPDSADKVGGKVAMPPGVTYADLGPWISKLCCLRPLLQEKIQAILKDLGPEFVAIHLRRTDLNNRFEEDSAIAEYCLQRYAGKLVYVASDNAKSVETIYEKLGREYVVASASFKADARELRQTSVADAVVDLWVSGKATAFVGTRGSSFSHFIEVLRFASHMPVPLELGVVCVDGAFLALPKNLRPLRE